MKQNLVEITFTGNNFSAYLPALAGCVSAGDTPAEIKKNITEAVAFHLRGMKEDKAPIPATFQGKYELVYKFNPATLLKYYNKLFKNSGLEKITGINQRQLQHYGSGINKPRKEQREKIQTALHRLGAELLAVEF